MAGGYYRGFIASTEILLEGEEAWRDVGQLPETTFGLSGVNLNNVIYMLGGDYYRDGFYEYQDWILEFLPDTQQWRQRGKMIKQRAFHAASVVGFTQFPAVIYCN